MPERSPYASLADLSVAFVPPTVVGVSDAGLLERQRELAEIRRRVDAAAAANGAEIVRRSSPELGHAGMAQSRGARTPAILVQRVAGISARDAGALLRVGSLLPDAAAPEPAEPVGPIWMREVAAAVVTGALSVEAAEAIRAGLGDDDTVEANALTEAAAILLGEAAVTPVDRLGARARLLRAELDLGRVQKRADALRARRQLHIALQPDGMTRIWGLLDPESAAIVTAAYDAATSPRRGGPRFVDPDQKARADELVADERTTEQIAVDAFVQLLEIASNVDPSKVVLGSRRAPVQVLVTARDLIDGTGIAFIDGQTEALPISLADRHTCTAGILPIQFDDDGQSLRLGRTSRLFTPRQKQAIAARDGGCLHPDCSRPPSWCEAHHINEVVRDHGLTDVEDGVLLCKHRHLWLHDTGRYITRVGANYYLLDLDGIRTLLPSKSRTLDRLRRTA